MDLIKLSIPAAFVHGKVHLTWREVLFGIENELLASEAAVEFACDQIVTQNNPAVSLVELAGLDNDNRVLSRSLVEQLAKAESERDVNEVRDKWLYLVLAWVFEHMVDYVDPLQTVETVYADFDHPERMASFVRYMPSNELQLESRALNQQRLHENWRCYLEEAAARYARKME